MWGHNCSLTHGPCTVLTRLCTRSFTSRRSDQKVNHVLGTLCLIMRPGSVRLPFLPCHEESSHGSHFKSAEELQKVMTAALNNLQQNYFWMCFDSLKHQDPCATAERNYYEVDPFSSEWNVVQKCLWGQTSYLSKVLDCCTLQLSICISSLLNIFHLCLLP